jgi:hypothetical protein
MKVKPSVSVLRTDWDSVSRVYALVPFALSVIASAADRNSGRVTGDGLQPQFLTGYRWLRGDALSFDAICGVLGREEWPVPERLTALAISSFANRGNRCWPGPGVAAARAGLSRREFLRTLGSLVERGAIVIEKPAERRGRGSELRLVFAEEGPWFEEDVNPRMVETVLARTAHRGTARLVLAAFAALADEYGIVSGFGQEDLREAAGVPETTFRRARTALLASGELEVLEAGGGRGRTTCWRIRLGDLPTSPAAGGRGGGPVGPVGSGPPGGSAGRPATSGESPVRGQAGAATPRAGSGGRKPRRASRSEIPPVAQPQTPPETTPSSSLPVGVAPVSGSESPPLNARAGREPPNLKTTPPDPPGAGGNGGDRVVAVEELYRTDRGRRRPRTVLVDVAAACATLRPPGPVDVNDWQRTQALLAATVGEDTFAIWLAPLELRAVNATGTLVVTAPPDTASWIRSRYVTAIQAAAHHAGRDVLLADDMLAAAIGAGGMTDHPAGQHPAAEAAGPPLVAPPERSAEPPPVPVPVYRPRRRRWRRPRRPSH